MFLLQDSKQSYISRTDVFWTIGYGTKKIVFLPFNWEIEIFDEATQPDQATKLVDSLILKGIKIYELDICTQNGNWL